MSVTTEKIRQFEDALTAAAPVEELFRLIVTDKDPERFDVALAYFQGTVPWPERIVLPLTEVLFIVEKDGAGIVKCRCGHELGDYRVNWKVHASVRVRRTDEQFREIYPPFMHAEEGWQELREFLCPGCATLLEVEAAAPGYPVLFDALPDVQSLYTKWLGRECPLAPHEYRDLTVEYLREHLPAES